ncbi:hypothetical protein GCM10011410_11270 [Hoyosella rhizosphaerae]|uniref:Uncharacterized protein n=1 Tax=Hoyosella rhizosphaerae TaxID=1755582 RepID=A0A916U4N1_9ACTN|nr:hypothetical protein GCM10011410_11270 [Hoyosella rhizosphaerae]
MHLGPEVYDADRGLDGNGGYRSSVPRPSADQQLTYGADIQRRFAPALPPDDSALLKSNSKSR